MSLLLMQHCEKRFNLIMTNDPLRYQKENVIFGFALKGQLNDQNTTFVDVSNMSQKLKLHSFEILPMLKMRC